MPFDGAGNFKRAYNWVSDAANAALDYITPSRMDGDANDLAAGLSNCITRDGQGVPTADVPWGGHKITGLASGVAPADAVNLAQMKTATGGGLVQGGQSASTAQNASVYVPFPIKFSAQPAVTCTAIAQSVQQFSVQIYGLDRNGFFATTLAGGQPSFSLPFCWAAVGPS